MKRILLGLVAAACLSFTPTTTSADDDTIKTLTIGPCALTELKITFHPTDPASDLPPLEIEAPKGCRCSFNINGLEFVPTAPMPDSFCGIGNPEDGVKKDKK